MWALLGGTPGSFVTEQREDAFSQGIEAFHGVVEVWGFPKR